MREGTIAKTTKARYWAALAALAFCVSACTTPYREPSIEPGDATFPGILDFVGAPGVQQTDIVSIHGMCTHTRQSWADPATAELAHALEAEPGELTLLATFDSLELYRASLSAAGTPVHHYAIVWSPMTTDIKATLCYDNSEYPEGYAGVCGEPTYAHKRASINANLKSSLMNDCLADVPAYLGERGPRIRNAVRQALSVVRQQRAGNEMQPLFIVTESLGSKVLHDALKIPDGQFSMSALNDLAVALAPTEVIFMAANQLPLLDLAGRATDTEGSETLRELVQSLQDASRSPRGQSMGLDADRRALVVAFTDPNDLLSYTLRDLPEDDVVNVIVSNSRTWFGKIEDPWAAHTGYLANESVWKLIARGSE